MSAKRIGTLWFDPGGTTGWALCSISIEDLFAGYDMRARIEEHGELTGSEDEQAFEIMGIAAKYRRSAMGIETFSPRKFSRDLTMYSPMRLRSKVQFGFWLCDVDRIIFGQSPSDAMTHLTDDRQRRHDLWIVGQEHARDAVKHCVTFFATAHDKPRLRPRAWPHIDWKGLEA